MSEWSASGIWKSALVAAAVSPFIWLYAELESVQDDEFSPVTVVVATTTGSDRAVWLDGAPRGETSLRVTISVTGATAAIDDLREPLGRPVELTPGLGLPTESGVHTVSLRDALRAHPVFRGSRVTVAQVEPPEVRVRIDDMVAVELAIAPMLPEGVQVTGPIQVAPTQAAVRFPASFRDWLTPESRVGASITPQQAGSLDRDRLSRLADVRLLPPAELQSVPFVRVEPSSASVSLTIRGQRAQATLPTVPVEIRIAPFLLQDWLVDIPVEDRILRDVVVLGPSQIVDQILAGRINVVAYVPITQDDLERRATSKEAIFADGPGSALEFTVASRRVGLRISRRDDPEGGGGQPPDAPRPDSQ